MGRHSIRHPESGLWSCFSTIVDDFICDWMTKEDYISWLLNKERDEIEYRLNQIEAGKGYQYSYEDACEAIALRNAEEDIDD